MKLRLLKLYDSLTDSFWFVPAVMALMATAAALGLVALDHAIGSEWVKNIGWVWSGGPDGARAVLSVIAGSVMTVVSIVFSLTISTLAQTSSHYGPRVLRNFTSDRGVQFTLGTYIATFVYCLLVLRTVRSVQESSFVPYLSVTVGILFALVSLGVLIFFIHFISQSIQAESLIDDVGRAFQRALPLLFPSDMGQDAHRDEPPGEAFWQESQVVAPRKMVISNASTRGWSWTWRSSTDCSSSSRNGPGISSPRVRRCSGCYLKPRCRMKSPPPSGVA